MVKGVASLLLLALVAVAPVFGPGLVSALDGPTASAGSPSGRVTAQATPSPVLTVSAGSVLPNQTIAVTGTGFSTGSAVTITSFSIGGQSIERSKINGGSTVAVQDSGNWFASLVIPVTSSILNAGTFSLKVTDSGGREGLVTLTVPSRTITVSPDKGTLGSTVTVIGSNFPISSSRSGADPTPSVNVQYEISGRESRVVASLVPDGTGGFTATFAVPTSAPIPSTNTVRATISGTTASTTITHSVPAATVTISQDKATPGATITITGNNFKPSAQLRSLTIGGIEVSPLPAPLTTAEGSFTANIVVPQMDAATHAVLAQVGDTVALTSLTVEKGAATPAAAPISTATAQALAALGAELVRVWHFDNATKAWTFYDPRPDFVTVNTLTQLVPDRVYWIKLEIDRSVTLNSKLRSLFKGWNLIGW